MRMDNHSETRKDGRLYSLDLLRGLDMFLLTVVGPVVAAYNTAFTLPDWFMGQFHHNWGGFTLWDLIMPLFIFMCGAAVPFALRKRMDDGRAGLRYWRHVASRVALLWVFGMVSQGRLLSFDALLVNPFNNTLQAIASGYLVAAIVLCIPSRRLRIAVPIVLAVGYAAFLHFCGDYTVEGNAATRFEYWILPRITPDGSKALALADGGYSWWATIPMFGAMTLCGMFATEILTSGASPMRRLANLSMLGIVLLVGGLAVSAVIPPIKHIFTLSFTAEAMGVCCLALALLYAVADVLGFRRGTSIFILFGQTSLMAYMCHEFKPVLRAFGKMFAPGAEHLFGKPVATVVAAIMSAAFLVAILHVWRRSRQCRA